MKKRFLMVKPSLEHISKLILVGKRPRQLPPSESSPKNWLFQDRFKSCFDTAKRKISARGFQIFRNYWNRKQKHIRGDKTSKHWKYIISVPRSYISVPMSQNMDLCGIRGQQGGVPKSILGSPPLFYRSSFPVRTTSRGNRKEPHNLLTPVGSADLKG